MDLFITRRGGAAAEKPALPVLDEAYPADVSIEYIRGNSASATFSVSIALAGVPAEYMYQWYVDDAPVDGATGETYTVFGALEAGTKAIYCKVTNRAGTVQSRTATLSVDVLYPPELESALPADVTGIQYSTTSATFSVGIASAGNPAEYTYQWYVNDAAVDGATGSSYTYSNFTSVATRSVYCKVTNRAGTVQSRTATLKILTYKPTYSYSGTSEFTDEGNGNWNLKLKSSGTLNFSKLDTKIDVFCVGGGGSGANRTSGTNAFGAGGGGGYTKTSKGISATKGSDYTITVGAGGAAAQWNENNGSRGGTTSAFGVSAEGGYGGTQGDTTNGGKGGNGGSGGAGYNSGSSYGVGTAGKDGGNGSGASGKQGIGQGTTTREFGLSGGTLYATGGRFGVNGAVSGGANTGNGGDGSQKGSSGASGAGGSGIVVIRNAR